MGTALQAIKDPQDNRSFQRMLDEVKNDPDKTQKIYKAIRRVIEEVLKNDRNLRDAFSLASESEIKKQVTDKFKKWKDSGSDPKNFPF